MLLGRLVLLPLLFSALAPGRGEGRELVRRYLTLDSADVAFLKGAFGAKADLDGLLYVLALTGLWLGIHVSDAEVDLGSARLARRRALLRLGSQPSCSGHPSAFLLTHDPESESSRGLRISRPCPTL